MEPPREPEKPRPPPPPQQTQTQTQREGKKNKAAGMEPPSEVNDLEPQPNAPRNDTQMDILRFKLFLVCILCCLISMSFVDSDLVFGNKYKHDVFLSFRGSDIRKDFLSHFENHLVDQKVEVFIDRKLERGKAISPGLMKAIRESKIGIIIFSSDFAASSYCLDEAEVMISHHGYRQRVMPLFHRLNPSDVEFQNGTFTEAFAKHEETYKCRLYVVQRWRRALTEATNLAGWVSSDFLTEHDMIVKIVHDVKQMLPKKESVLVTAIDRIIKIWRQLMAIYKALGSAYDRFVEEAFLR